MTPQDITKLPQWRTYSRGEAANLMAGLGYLAKDLTGIAPHEGLDPDLRDGLIGLIEAVSDKMGDLERLLAEVEVAARREGND